MKAKRRWSALLLAALLLGACAGCGEQKPEETEDCPLSLTRQEMLEDYDAMWQLIEENYPFQGVAERVTGRGMEEVKKEYREKLKDIQRQNEFYPLLEQCLAEFKQGSTPIGHLGMVKENEYLQYYKRKETSSPTLRYWMDVLNNEASYRFYGVAEEEGPTARGMQEWLRPVNIVIDGFDLTVASIDEEAGVGIIKIQSMFPGVHDDEAFQAFFEQMRQHEIGSCIIDIRGNPGGSMNYWIDNIVAPNISQPLESVGYAVMKGAKSLEYLASKGVRPMEDLPDLPGINSEDMQGMDGYIESRVRIEPSAEAPLWQGKFYLLVDGSNYSSAEAMANFCKQTGFATLVGTEHTGGDGVGATMPICFALPHSGIAFQFTVLHGLNPDGSSNQEFGTAPDILVEGDARKACLDLISRESGK